MPQSKTKNELRTVRFTPAEGKLINSYLKRNPVFESFSSLARVATLSFLSEKGIIALNPVQRSAFEKRPVFLWDYDLTENQVYDILGETGLTAKKKWLIERILTQCSFKDIFRYLNLATIKAVLPHVRLKPKTKEAWNYAIQRWTTNHSHSSSE